MLIHFHGRVFVEQHEVVAVAVVDELRFADAVVASVLDDRESSLLDFRAVRRARRHRTCRIPGVHERGRSRRPPAGHRPRGRRRPASGPPARDRDLLLGHDFDASLPSHLDDVEVLLAVGDLDDVRAHGLLELPLAGRFDDEREAEFVCGRLGVGPGELVGLGVGNAQRLAAVVQGGLVEHRVERVDVREREADALEVGLRERERPLVHATEGDGVVVEFGGERFDVLAEARLVVQRVGNLARVVDGVRGQGRAVARAVECDHWHVVGVERPSHREPRDVGVGDERRRAVEVGGRERVAERVEVPEGHASVLPPAVIKVTGYRARPPLLVTERGGGCSGGGTRHAALVGVAGAEPRERVRSLYSRADPEPTVVTMSEKPASMYRKIDKPSYTRRDYVTGIPGSKIAQHQMGDLQADKDDYPVQISLAPEEECQLRHGSLEASRLSANRHLIKELGEGNYKMSLRKFPTRSSGRTSRRLARVRTVSPTGCARRSASRSAPPPASTRRTPVHRVVRGRPGRGRQEAFRRAYNKITPPCKIVVERGEELLVR